jgi:hypothetical protein
MVAYNCHLGIRYLVIKNEVIQNAITFLLSARSNKKTKNMQRNDGAAHPQKAYLLHAVVYSTATSGKRAA